MDDATVTNETRLYRRVSPQFIKPEGDTFRVSSGAFQNTSGTNEMSVSLGDTLEEIGTEPASLLDDFPGYGLVSLTAGLVRGEEQTVRRSPTEQDPAHGDVIGEKSGGRRKRFARQLEWAVLPA